MKACSLNRARRRDDFCIITIEPLVKRSDNKTAFGAQKITPEQFPACVRVCQALLGNRLNRIAHLAICMSEIFHYVEFTT